jgi:hypothetical protein
MALTDTAIRNVKPKERPFKLADGNGLYLFVTPRNVSEKLLILVARRELV